MKIKIIIAILLLNQISCKSQTKDTLINNNIKKDTMRYFNKEKYKKLQKNPKYSDERCYIDTNGDEIRITGSLTDITEEITKNDSPITTYWTYYANGVQKAYIQNYYFFPVGKGKEFGTNGEIIKETNFDEPYKFSVEDLRAKLKKEYEIDIIEDYKSKDSPYGMPNIQVNRWLGYDKDWSIYKKGVPMYQVSFLNKEKIAVTLVINATDGTTISKEIEGENKRSSLPNDKNKNTVPYIDRNNDNNDDNNKPLFIIALLLALLVITAIVYFKYKEEAEYNRIHLVK